MRPKHKLYMKDGHSLWDHKKNPKYLILAIDVSL